MTAVLIALSGPVALSAALWPLITYLKARDASDAAERQIALQRIQAPEVAIAQHVTGTEAPAHLPFDDDVAWSTYQDELTERVARG